MAQDLDFPIESYAFRTGAMRTSAAIASSSPATRADALQRSAADKPPRDHPAPSLGREKVYTVASIAVTLVAAVMLGFDVGPVLVDLIRGHQGAMAIFMQASFIAIIYFFIYGELVYLLARLGYLERRMAHRDADRAELETPFDCENPPSLTILVPSYREEKHVVAQTLLSAALMEYPRRRIVLLIDDPPNPDSPAAARQLAEMRALPGEMERMLRDAGRPFRLALGDFEQRRAADMFEARSEGLRLAALYARAARWFEAQAQHCAGGDHTDALCAERILFEPARALRAWGLKLEGTSRHGAAQLSERAIYREYRRLASLFSAELTSFERKQYVNLSHAANKAMNLNSYIALVGHSLREVRRSDGLHLEHCEAADADLVVPDAEYIITLDADSLLLADYALKLVHVMERPGNERVAVAQTPYCAVPGTPVLLERVAGATTDMQHIIHQGTTRFSGTYWVGANALLRKRALDDIREVFQERGFPIPRYIQDHTVIEDTESTVDLIAKGWTLYNYPDRLAYSATPPDFGALVIQRRRWANGGLLILPKLLRYLLRGPGRLARLGEGFMRVHYLTSLAVVSLGILILLALPFEGAMRSLWLPLSAIPYFWLYGRDLVASGYRWGDLARVYALNLLLIPINLGGVAKSLHQAVTGRNSPFGRTPKVRGRTAAPRLYIVAPLVILAYCIAFGALDLANARWVHAGFMALNAGFFWYSLCYLVGLREAAEDLGLIRIREALRGVLDRRQRIPAVFNPSVWRGGGASEIPTGSDLAAGQLTAAQPIAAASARPFAP
jgi:cellulose synthase/poly-beta-1,6-N-acetylglucosamine synthase-like glycosyltransferase